MTPRCCKAVILAAGRGTRMGTLTAEIPKPMLSVEGKPILQWILEGMREAGIRQACVVTGWQASVIESHFGDGSSLGMELVYVRQEVADGTGRAPLLARGFVGGDPFLLSYGDILVRPRVYADLLERWHRGDCDGVVTVTRGQDVTQGGLLFFDKSFLLEALVEKPTPAEITSLRQQGRLLPDDPVWYNAGIYLFTPELLSHAERLVPSPRGEYELTDALRTWIQSGARVAGLEIAGRWVDVRDPGVLAELARDSAALFQDAPVSGSRPWPGIPPA
jgi:dTDP-glucose pyrophosphorylase